MNFETKLRKSLETALSDHRASVAVRAIRMSEWNRKRAYTVEYNLGGSMASAARFTFTFEEDADLDARLADFRDFCDRNWAGAHLPPTARANTARA